MPLPANPDLADTLAHALLEAKRANPAGLRRQDIAEILRPLLAAAKPKRKPKVADMGDAEWVESLKQDEAFKGLNIPAEIARCAAWYRQNVSKVGQPSRRRVVNWLLKADRVADLKAMGATHATGLKLPPPAGPSGWREWLKREIALLTTDEPDHPALSQLTAAHLNNVFTMMPQSWQAKCRNALSTHEHNHS